MHGLGLYLTGFPHGLYSRYTLFLCIQMGKEKESPGGVEDELLKSPPRRSFIVTMATATAAVGGVIAVAPFVSSWLPSEEVLATGSVTVDISELKLGEVRTVKFRGKPVVIRKRSQEEIKDVRETPISSLKDPKLMRIESSGKTRLYARLCARTLAALPYLTRVTILVASFARVMDLIMMLLAELERGLLGRICMSLSMSFLMNLK